MITEKIDPVKAVNEAFPSLRELLGNIEYEPIDFPISKKDRKWIEFANKIQDEDLDLNLTAYFVNKMNIIVYGNYLFVELINSPLGNPNKIRISPSEFEPIFFLSWEVEAIIKIIWFKFSMMKMTPEQAEAYNLFLEKRPIGNHIKNF